jgi:hypothetical protein
MAKKAKVWSGTEWVDLAAATADLSQYANLTTTPISGFRNAIINGDFRINQRAFTSVTADNSYGFDRWMIEVSGGCTYTPVAFALGNAILGYEPINHARLVTTGQSGTGVYSILEQRIEDVRTFAGQTITLSFWARANSGTPKVSAEFNQFWGSSATTNNNAGSVTLSTTWQRYSLTTTLGSASGKTIAGNHHLGLLLWVSAGTDFSARTNSIGIQSNTFEFWGVQVEQGSVATPFEQRPIGTELALCQRYFTRVDTQGTSFYTVNAVSAANGEFNIVIPLPVQMRSIPTPSTNISAFVSTAPTGTQVSLYRGAYVGGTWTSNVLRASKNHIWVAINGWSGTNVGTSGALDIGSGVIFDANSEL